MNRPVDVRLYAAVRREADKKFDAHGVYKSSWIVREYKRRGGRYQSIKKPSSGLQRWFREQWVDLNRPIRTKSGAVAGYEACGRTHATMQSTSRYPLCRPSVRVNKSTPRTYREMSEQEIATAKRDKARKTRHLVASGGGTAQYYGRKSDVNLTVPAAVKKWALYAFKLRDVGFQGATRTGWLRAKQLATKDAIPIEDVRYMSAWYRRHVYTSYPTYQAWEAAGRPKTSDWFRKRGIIAWLTWGGTSGLKWMNSPTVLRALSKHYNKRYERFVRKN